MQSMFYKNVTVYAKIQNKVQVTQNNQNNL
jgi:hypothetical protein